MCWERKIKSCVNGHNIIKHPGKTITQCKKLCVDEPKCLAFEYGMTYIGGATTTYSAYDCQLQDSSDAEGCDGGLTNLDLWTKVSCKREGKIIIIVQYFTCRNASNKRKSA